jgi:drug/metabolite transporter (DMT)-like permease
MELFQIYSGEIAAIITAMFWAVTATSFEHCAKKIGSINLNILRLFAGIIFLSVFTLITRGFLLPFDASISGWGWLLLSGFVGIVAGDLFLFEAFVRIGSRTSMLIYSTVPLLSGLMALIFLGEKMTGIQIVGMFVTLSGIATVILVRDAGRKMTFTHPFSGIFMAFLGALGQAAGYVIGKHGMADYDPFASTQIRLIAGIIGFSIIFTIRGKWSSLSIVLKKKEAMGSLLLGSFFGPFLGISLSLYAVQKINPGVASTLTSIVPVFLIIYATIFKKEKITFKEIIGTAITILGVAIMFMR